jgi:Fe2+ or Zn2+ uptake regulation protein
MTSAVTPALMPRRQPAPTVPATRPGRPVRHLSVDARRTVLLAAIHTRRGVWTTKRACDLYATAVTDQHIYPPTVRRDLVTLWAAGHLDRHETNGRTSYTLATKGPTT